MKGLSIVLTFSIAAAGLTTTGCGALQAPAPPQLPAYVELVVDRFESFMLDDQTEAHGREGAPVDLASLQGCWGRTEFAEMPEWPLGATAQAQTATVYRFDDAGETEWAHLVRDATGQFAVVLISSGTYSVPEPGALWVRFEQALASDPLTGEMLPVPGTRPYTLELTATMSDDLLGLRRTIEEADHPKIPVLRRFDCPQ